MQLISEEGLRGEITFAQIRGWFSALYTGQKGEKNNNNKNLLKEEDLPTTQV